MLKLLSPTDMAEGIQKLYNEGMPPGESTGWHDLDPLYTVSPGFMTIVTGMPNAGKSPWVENLMVNLMRKGWKFVVYSPENMPPALFLAQLIEKIRRKPFRPAYNDRLTPADMAHTITALEDRLRLLEVDDEGFPSIHQICEATDEIIEAEKWTGKVGLILDPWNEMDHSPLRGMNETQMCNWELMHFRRWLRARSVHGFIVAHPNKPQQNKDGTLRKLTLYDINGSAAFFNKADMGVIVRRLDDGSARVEIDVQKVKFRHMGQRGSCMLRFNVGTQVFTDDITKPNIYTVK